MKIYINSGYYSFFPENPMDITIANKRGLNLVSNDGHYTFASLKELAPTFSLIHRNGMNVQYAGTPVEVMDNNKMVYDMNTQLIVPIHSITVNAGLYFDGTRITCVGIPQAGAKVDGTNRLRSCVVSWRPETNACIVQGVELWNL